VKIASLQTSFVALDIVIKVTNRRVNALEYVVIPRFIETMRYIETELKKVLNNKKKFAEQEEMIKATTMAELKASNKSWKE